MAIIILLKDVPKVGQRGDVKDIKDGFFRNFLLPKNLAELATPEKIKKHEEDLATRIKAKEKSAAQDISDFKRIGETRIEFRAKAGEKGGLYKAVSEKDISERLSELGFKNIKPNWIKIKNPLKELGEASVEVESPHGSNAKLKIIIKRE